MKRYWPAIVIGVAVLLLGGTGVLFYCHWENVTFSLDLGSVLDAVVFLLIGAFIEYAYSKQYSDKRSDTELLLEIVREAREALSNLDKESQACSNARRLNAKQLSSLHAANRELSHAVHSIEEAVTHCKADLNKMEFGKVKAARSTLWESISDTPYPGPYDLASLNRIRLATKAMRDELTRIAFAINHR